MCRGSCAGYCSGSGSASCFNGLREIPAPVAGGGRRLANWRPVVFVTLGLVLFGSTIERLGLVLAILLLIGVGSLASRSLRPWETLAAALVLIALSWAIFIAGLGLTIPVWPDW